MKYVVAHMSRFDSELKLTTVEADDPITALIEGVRKLENDLESNEWLDSLLITAPPHLYRGLPRLAEARIKEIQDEFFNIDQAVAVLQI